MSWFTKHKGATIGSVAGPVGTAVGAGYDAYAGREKRKQREAALRAKDRAQGYAGDPNVELIYKAGQRGPNGEVGDYADVLGDISKGFKGSSKQLAQHYERFRPQILAQLLKTRAARDLTDTDRYAQLAYAPGANLIEQNVNQGLRSLRGSLAMNGLTAGGVYPGLEASLRFQAASARGALMNQVQMEQLQNRYNLQRDVASLGAGIPVQQPGGDNSNDQWMQILMQLMQGAGTIGAAAISRR